MTRICLGCHRPAPEAVSFQRLIRITGKAASENASRYKYAERSLLSPRFRGKNFSRSTRLLSIAAEGMFLKGRNRGISYKDLAKRYPSNGTTQQPQGDIRDVREPPARVGFNRPRGNLNSMILTARRWVGGKVVKDRGYEKRKGRKREQAGRGGQINRSRKRNIRGTA